jgi:hypothetical protein
VHQLVSRRQTVTQHPFTTCALLTRSTRLIAATSATISKNLFVSAYPTGSLSHRGALVAAHTSCLRSASLLLTCQLAHRSSPQHQVGDDARDQLLRHRKARHSSSVVDPVETLWLIADTRMCASQVQKEGLGMDKCIEDSKYRMVRGT